ncbi:MAG: hypothetical protein ABEJ91_03575 [Candidatus Nanohaloarchaea archaeon]
MMEDEEYEDYLVDKAKEILNEEIVESDEEDMEAPEMKNKRNQMDEKAEKDSTSRIPFSWDPQEIEHLTRNRTKMSNEEMKEFFERDSDFQEKMEKIDEWKGFSRWEERLMVQQHSVKSVEEIAEELERDRREIELKMHMMGLKVDVDE